MRKKEKNKQIVKKIRKKLNKQGLSGKLDVFPVETPFTRRPRHWTNSDGINVFKVLMWSVNELDDKQLDKVIDARIDEARKYFEV